MVLILEWGLKEILKRLNVTMENAFHGACEYLMGYKNRGTFRQNLVGWVGNFSEEVNIPVSSVQFSSVTQSCPTLCDPMNRSTPGFPVHHQLLGPPEPMSIESMMPSSHLILCRPLLLLPSIFPSTMVFS